MKKVALVLTHGMGEIRKTEFDQRIDDVRQRIGNRIGDALNDQILYVPIFYQDILQENQRSLWDKTRREKPVGWKGLRKFLLFGFSDAAGLEHKAHLDESEYKIVQQRILDALDRVFDHPDRPRHVVILAQSLGCQVLSNYIWDSQQPRAAQGIWKDGQIDGEARGSEKDDFRRLKNLRSLYTTGCNIPIFVAGKRPLLAVTTRTHGYNFDWQNYYDKDDVLGWPLRPMGHFFDPSKGMGSGYDEAVTADHSINSSGGFWAGLWAGWNPASHLRYWRDSSVIKPLANQLRTLVQSS